MSKKMIHLLLGIGVAYHLFKGRRNPYIDPNERLPMGIKLSDIEAGMYDGDEDEEVEFGEVELSPHERLPFGFMAPSDDEL